MKPNYNIFISYRRAGGFESANLITEKLRHMGYSVFFDVESLRSGKFNEQLYNVIEQCKDFVVVLPEKALDRCSKEDGTANEEDWIRKEVLFAMQHGKNIVPVMLAGFEWPERMPVGMEALKDYQAITASSHEYFDLAMKKMSSYLLSKPNKHKMLKKLAFVVAILVVISAIAYLALLQIAKPVCKSLANEYAYAMGLVNQLRNEEESLKAEWDAFLGNIQSAKSQVRKADLETDMLAYLGHEKENLDDIQKQIRPTLPLSDWQTLLMGLYGVQKEDVHALPAYVNSYVEDFQSLTDVIEQTMMMNTYKPSETKGVSHHFQFFEYSVNSMYYTYLQELTKLPKSCLKVHLDLSRSWKLLPNTALTLSQEEYERLAMVEMDKMEDVIGKMERGVEIQDDDLYNLSQKLDTIMTAYETSGLIHDLPEEDDAQAKLQIDEERVSMKREIVEQKKAELAEKKEELLKVYEELKSNCQLKSTDGEGYQWGKIARMAKMLRQCTNSQAMALEKGIKTGAIIGPSVVYNDLSSMLDDYIKFHPTAQTYVNPLRAFYKMVADGKVPMGGQLIIGFKDDEIHPLYKVGDIVIKRNGAAITDYESLTSAISENKQGSVEFLRLEGSGLTLHKETVPESSVLVGYMEVSEY